MLKILVVVTPLATLAVWVLVRALRGRPLSRYALNVVVALFLLGYLLVTAALGVFWVARMDLPAFDWHYLFGYVLVLLASVHVALQLPVLSAWLKRSIGRPTVNARGASQSRRALAVVGTFGLVGLLAWWLGRKRRAPATLRAPPAATSSGTSASGPEPVEPVVDRDGRTLDIAAYLYEESSYSRAGVLRAVGLAPPRPSDVKEYTGLPRVRLPLARSRAGGSLAAALVGLTRASGSETPVPAASLGLQELADIAFHGAGVTDGSEGSGMRFRAAASSGALYPTDLYVLVRSIAGLEPGAYYYDPHAHVLVRTAAASALDAVLRASDLGSVGALPWALVLGATYDRTVSKYNIRSCRYLPLDAGHLAANLMLSASALGHQLVADPWFDDGLIGRELGLDPDVEAPLLVIRGGTPRAHPPLRRRRNLPGDLATGELTRLAHELTSWELAGEASRASEGRVPASPLSELVRGSATVSLGAAEPARGDLFEIVRSRRSFRAFSRRAVRTDDVASVLGASTSLLPSVRGGSLVEPYLLVRAVAGLEPGVYRYDAGRSALEPLSRGDRSRDIERAGLDQELLGRAAFVVAWSFVPERLGRLDGARDFRTAGLAAGFAGEVAYLTASARGLGICGVGAFYDGDVNALVPGNKARVAYLMGVGARA